MGLDYELSQNPELLLNSHYLGILILVNMLLIVQVIGCELSVMSYNLMEIMISVFIALHRWQPVVVFHSLSSSFQKFSGMQ